MIESRLLTQAEQECKDINFQQVAETEAQIGGVQLPLGLQNQVAFIDQAEARDESNRISYRLSCKAVTPGDYAGTSFSLFYNFGPSYNKEGAQVRSKRQNIEEFTNDMKLMGFDATEFKSVTDLWAHVDEVFNDSKQKKRFLYNTLNKANKSGYPIPVVAGNAEDDQDAPPARPKKGKPDLPTFKVGDQVETTGDYFGDGGVYYGEVKTVKEDQCEVLFHDDNSVDDIPLENLIKSATPSSSQDDDETSPFNFGMDDQVLCKANYFGDGEQYEGRVTAIDGTTITVEFEDGEVVDMEADDLELA